MPAPLPLSRSLHNTSTILRAGVAAAVICISFQSATSTAQEKPAFDPSTAQDAKLPLPSPYDKLLSIEVAMDGKPIDWAAIYNSSAVDIDVNRLTDRPDLALAMGIKIADGIVAVKGQNLEHLNACADQIEAIAKKLGATDDDLARARIVRDYANRGRWLNVFMELGFLQSDIMKILNRDGNEHDRPLIVAAGWMQGARHVTELIEVTYSPEISNTLREPVLVKAVAEDLKKLPENLQANSKVAALRQAFEQAIPVVDIGVDAPVSQEQVQVLRKLADDTIRTLTAN